MYRALLAVLLAFLLSGCGEVSSRAPQAVTRTPAPLVSPSATASLHPPKPPRAIPHGCAGQQVGVRPSIIDAATGHRYLLLTVRNCAEVPLELPVVPELRMVSRSGEESALKAIPWAPEQEPLILASRETAYLGLEWRAVGRNVARADRIEVMFVGASTTLIDTFDLGRRSVVTIHAWARNRDQAWPS